MFNVLIAYIYYILIECPFGNIFRLVYSRASIAPTDDKSKSEGNNNSSQIKDMNGLNLTISVNGNTNNITELSKL